MKSFDELANPHRYVKLPETKRRRNTKNKKVKHNPQPKVLCRVVPFIVVLHPFILDLPCLTEGRRKSRDKSPKVLLNNVMKQVADEINLRYNML